MEVGGIISTLRHALSDNVHAQDLFRMSLIRFRVRIASSQILTPGTLGF